MKTVELKTPLRESQTRTLSVGDIVYLSGKVYTARDMAHIRMLEQKEKGQTNVQDLSGQVIFHAGPIARQDKNGRWQLVVIGPTTSIRMEPFADLVGGLGVKAILGKGGMAEKTVQGCERYGYVYLQAAPGCAAQLSGNVQGITGVDWLELGMPEAIWELEVERFGPFVVGMDTHGASIYQTLRDRATVHMHRMYPKSKALAD